MWCVGYGYSVLKCGAGGCVVCDMCGLLDACVVWLMCGVGEMCVVCEVCVVCVELRFAVFDVSYVRVVRYGGCGAAQCEVSVD